MSPSERKETVWFSVIVIILSSLICFLAYRLDDMNLSILSVFTPSLVALVMTAMSSGRKGLYDLFVRQTIRGMPVKWLLISALGIPVLASLAVLTYMNFDLGSFGLRTTRLMPQVIVILLIALGEEYGWRGFMLPRLLNRFSAFHSSVILGLVWGFWHFPAYLIGTGVPKEMNFFVFLLWVVLGTLFMSWVYYYTRSVLTSILIHISANAAFNYLPLLPEFTGSMKTFWIFVSLLSLFVFLIYFLNRNLLLSKEER